jgi:ABC-2 type transport system permease protein
LDLLAIIFLSVYVLDVPVIGSMFLLLAESTLYIITCLALGILISIRTDTQESAMFASLIGMMLPTIMLSGFMFPIENMPLPLQIISDIIPSKWFYIIVKDVMIKGADFSSVWDDTLFLAGIAFVLFIISVKKFKIRLN